MPPNTAHIGHVSDNELEILRMLLKQEDSSGIVVIENEKTTFEKEAESIKQKVDRSKRNYTPPRSMTEEEKEWYKIHKSLKGFVK